MNYQIKLSTIKTTFTLLGIAFYTKLVTGLSLLVTGRGTNPYVENAAGNFLNKAFGLSLLAACILIAIRSKRLIALVTDTKQALIISLVFYALFSVLWSVEPSVSFKRVVFLLSVFAFCYYLVEAYDYRTVFKYLGYTIGVCAVLSLISGVLIPEKVFLTGGGRAGALKGIFVDKNAAARTYMIGISLLMLFVFEKDRKAIFFTVCCAVSLLLTKSVSGILLLIISVGTLLYLYWATLYRQNSTLYRYKVRFSLLWYLILAAVAYSMYAIILELFGRDATLTNRTLIWEIIWPFVSEKLQFGWGYGAFWASTSVEEFLNFWGYTGNAHNGFIETLLHGGVVLLVLIIAIILTTLYRLLKYENLVKTPLRNYICASLILTLTVANYVGYTIPNHNSLDFFIFCYVVLLSAKKVAPDRRYSKQGINKSAVILR